MHSIDIAQAFRPGNVDLPANQSHAVNPASLTLPETLTELDLLAPMPDPALLLGEMPDVSVGGQDPTLLDWGTSQLLSESIEQPRRAPSVPLDLPEDDLELDIGEGPTDISIEQPRRAPAPLRSGGLDDDDLKLYDDDLELDIGGDEPPFRDSMAAPAIQDDTLDIPMGDIEDTAMPVVDEGVIVAGALPPASEGEAEAEAARQRETASPLSSIRSSVERELESTFRQEATVYEPEDETVVQAQRSKRRRVLQNDEDTTIHNTQIRAQQNDRSNILKPASFLPRDPMLLALMNLQRTGGFVSSILGDDRSRGWAPELRGILSIEVVRRSGDLKRKRDSGVADVEDEEEQARSAAEKTPQLQFEQEEDLGAGAFDVGGDTTLGGEVQEDLGIAPPMGEEEEGVPRPVTEEEEDEALSPPQDNFDDTTMPVLHPADAGPVSQGTRHAVHLLREQFGEEAAEDSAVRQRTSVKFQDLLPERTTSKVDATKMFFEVLVLATKDAVKVEQSADQLGGPIRIRGKRGLWGSWAEASAGGEIASQAEGAGAVQEVGA